MNRKTNPNRRAIWVPNAVHARIERLAAEKSGREDGREVAHGEIVADAVRLLESVYTASAELEAADNG
jgi:hypothetical protein